MPKHFIVTNSRGLYVRSQTDTTNPYNKLRKMSNGEGFEVYEIYPVKGMTGLQIWGRISDNPGGITQEFTCLSIGNKTYAKEETGTTPPTSSTWAQEIDAWARLNGYHGVHP